MIARYWIATCTECGEQSEPIAERYAYRTDFMRMLTEQGWYFKGARVLCPAHVI